MRLVIIFNMPLHTKITAIIFLSKPQLFIKINSPPSGAIKLEGNSSFAFWIPIMALSLLIPSLMPRFIAPSKHLWSATGFHVTTSHCNV